MQKGFAPILILVGMVVLSIIAGGAYYLGTRSSVSPVPYPTPESKNDELAICIKDKENRYGNEYIKGQLVVGFNTSSEKEAKKIVEDYGLELVDESLPYQSNKLVVKVPKLTEFEWMCKLEGDQNIKDIKLTFNYDGVAF